MENNSPSHTPVFVSPSPLVIPSNTRHSYLINIKKRALPIVLPFLFITPSKLNHRTKYSRFHRTTVSVHVDQFMRSMLNQRNTPKNTIVVLTLKRHEGGIWIRRLVQELIATLSANDGRASTSTETNQAASGSNALGVNGGDDIDDNAHDDGLFHVKVHAIEEWLGEGWMVSAPCFHGVAAIINRISDAAPPHLFKASLAVLGAAQVLGIPVINGPSSFLLCSNKWCQHVLFQQARLPTPSTWAFFNTSEFPAASKLNATSFASSSSSISSMKVQIQEHGDDHANENGYLIKPNAGGFGAGIVKITEPPKCLPVFEDGVTLLQSYVPPNNRKLYRVWFLNGRVQCAVERTITARSAEDPDQKGEAQDIAASQEFTGACASGQGTVCSISPTVAVPNNSPLNEFTGACASGIAYAIRDSASTPTPPTPTPIMPTTTTFEAYRVPEAVRNEIQQQLLPLLPDAFCGSVEFLYTEQGRRLYFDLNMLSTLPVQVSDPHNVWEENYDPWKELAQSILQTLRFTMSHSSKTHV